MKDFDATWTRYKYCVDRAEELSDLAIELEQKWLSVSGIRYDREPSGHNGSFDKSLAYVIRKDEIMDEIADLNSERKVLKPTIELAIEQADIPDKYSGIARRYFVDLQTIQQIATSVGYVYRHVDRIVHECKGRLDEMSENVQA